VNYRDALAWLYGTQTFGIKLGLDNTRRLLAAAGDPHERLKFLHVAGTNGKGSVCAMLDSVLREGGVRSGLFTSPHLVEFRERIRVDGVEIPEEAAAEGLTLLRDASSTWDHQPTFFEITAALAAWWFDRAGAEIVVWETGMGGRLDATNVVTPLVSVITPIGLDHQRWLGSTLAEIAGEKAGIIKSGVPVVCGPQDQEALAVIKAKTKAQSSSFLEVTAPYDGPLSLPGAHQQWNAASALAALDAADLVPDKSVRARGLALGEADPLVDARHHQRGEDGHDGHGDDQLDEREGAAGGSAAGGGAGVHGCSAGGPGGRGAMPLDERANAPDLTGCLGGIPLPGNFSVPACSACPAAAGGSRPARRPPPAP